MSDGATVSDGVSRRVLLQSAAGAAAVGALATACSASTSGGSSGGGTAGAQTFMSTQFTPVEERQKYEAVLKKGSSLFGVAYGDCDVSVVTVLGS